MSAQSYAFGGTTRATARTDGPDVATNGLSPGTVTDQHLVPGTPVERRNGFAATLANLSEIHFVLRDMGISAGEALIADLKGDGKTKIHLVGAIPARRHATLDGDPVALKREKGGVAVTVDLSGGTSKVLALG